jgi:hypothetical protein
MGRWTKGIGQIYNPSEVMSAVMASAWKAHRCWFCWCQEWQNKERTDYKFYKRSNLRR